MRLARLKRERAALRDAGDVEQAAAIDRDIHYIARELDTTTGLGGRPRVFQTPAERVRKAVSTAVGRTKRSIADVHPTLSEHFNASLRTGTYCSYQHHPAPDWKT